MAATLGACTSIPPADPTGSSDERRAAWSGGADVPAKAVEPEPNEILGEVVPAAATPESTPAATEIATIVREHYEHLAARNWAGVAAHFWPGATILRVATNHEGAPSGVVGQTVEEYLADAARLPSADDPLVFELIGRDVAAADNVAHVLARFRARSSSADDVHVWDGVDAFVLARRDGCWKIAALLVGSEIAND